MELVDSSHFFLMKDSPSLLFKTSFNPAHLCEIESRLLMPMQPLRKFFNLPNKEKTFFIRTALELISAKIKVKFLPFRWIAKSLGKPNLKELDSPTSAEKMVIGQISRAVQRTAHYLPGDYVCLPQAIAAQRMLKSYHIHSTLFLGLKYSKEELFTSHAWLCVGNTFVTGEQPQQGYKKVITYTN